ncbi:RNAse PH [Sulfobacillus thermosulfidooxidans DSM 9293]|uniref:Ribonuclease PH n=1 Tax=Sulfobacillus thermosulfidooxidans (strain DSM 9293 / VKM B-1269 / AT-1) TaxID=929705 RepID=A0A1W1W8Q3_SULTA|nr:ribonuclease PH [Sulfobacillus thermosulfidooxidans]SMC02678.1 RNAse PH [Sulfobacillus thermosulfidooxidans DSM 9293]
MGLRQDGRSNDAIRPVDFQLGFNAWAEGSCLISVGNTRVLVTATVEDKVPPFVRGSGQGWVSAEYGMLPRATHERTMREAARGRQQGRTIEIQRLIGRSLRAILNLKALGEKSILLDCDVIQADGGTRTAAITAGFMALTQALTKIHKTSAFTTKPLKDWMAAISVGLHGDEVYLDLNYHEDSQIGVDMNVVMTSKHQLIEIQGTAEHGLFSRTQLDLLLDFVEPAIDELIALEKSVLPEGALLIG